MIILYEEPQGYVGVTFDEVTDKWYMHVELSAWSLSEYKRYLKIFQVIKNNLKTVTPEVFSVCDTDKEFKFNQLFGFEDTGLLVEEFDGNIAKLGRLEL